MEPTEFKQMQAKALEQLRNGQSLTGKDGVFAPLNGRKWECDKRCDYDLIKNKYCLVSNKLTFRNVKKCV